MNYNKLAEAKATINFNEIPVDHLTHAFSYARDGYLDESSLYTLYFKYLPNRVAVADIDCRAGLDWCLAHYTASITHCYYNEHYMPDRTTADETTCVYLVLKKDLLLTFDCTKQEVILLFRETPRAAINTLADGLLAFKKINKTTQAKIGLLTTQYSELQIDFIAIQELDTKVHLFYNDDFLPVHKRIQERLLQQDAKGLVLLHGLPGTGKTSYIRYLIRQLNKEVIFIPPNMAYALTNPDFIKLMAEHKNSVLVIEDAELLLKDRTAEGVSPVSGLLNLTDGLLSDCLHLQIICTFNIPLHKIDPALLRKGRLLARYEFKELEPHKANALSKHLGLEVCFDKATTLTDVVNQDEPAFVQKEPAGVGFK